jgi:AraC-like DNA-binding protein
MTQKKQYSAYARGAVTELQQYMDKHPITYKTITDLWKARPGDSRSMIEKAFKPITGYRIKEYLVKLRLEYTKQYLRNGMSIKRVAAKCFYKSQSAYCTAFRRYFNQSPTDWLKDEQQGYQSTG